MHEIKLSVRDHEVSVTEVGGTMVAGTVDHWTLSADFDAECEVCQDFGHYAAR